MELSKVGLIFSASLLLALALSSAAARAQIRWLQPTGRRRQHDGKMTPGAHRGSAWTSPLCVLQLS